MTVWILYTIACLILFFFAKTLIKISKRVLALKNQLSRLSLTFLKIENDIDAIHNALIVLANDEDRKGKLVKLKHRRQRQFQDIVENGIDAPEMMRGLEEPDIDEYPNYWSPNRRTLFGFDQKE